MLVYHWEIIIGVLNIWRQLKLLVLIFMILENVVALL